MGPIRATAALLLVGLMSFWLVATASTADAHAILVATSPGDATRIDEAPPQVDFEFSEPVELELGGLAVFDSSGNRVDAAGPSTNGTTVSIDLVDGLPDDTYIATYRVVSEDGHPINGAIVFTVGTAASSTSFDVDQILGDQDQGWEGLAAVARFVTYSVALVIGGIALYRRIDPAATRAVATGTGARAATAIGVVTALAAIPLQAVIASGRGLEAAWELDLLRRVLEDDVGTAALVTAAGLASLAWRPDASWSWIAGAVAVLGFAVTGHPRASSPVVVTVLANAVHVLAVALWIGGLIVVFLSFRDEPPDAIARIVERFSRTAFFTFTGAAVVGVVMAWAEVRALRALTSTTYGWLLIAKVAAVGAVGAIALYNRRRLVPRIAESGSRATLVRTTTAEIIGFLVIIALTTMLVTTTPARADAGVSGLFVERLELNDDLRVEMVVDPNRAGDLNEVHLYFTDPAGRPVELTDVEVAMALPAKDIQPVRRTPFRAGPGHMLMSGRELTIPGDWQITITTQLDEFTQAAATFDVPVS